MMNTSFRTDAQRTRTTRKPVNDPSPYTYDAIPAELRTYRQWLPWRLSSTGKKLPFNPQIDPASKVNELADTTDPATWGTYEDAVYILGAGLQQRSLKGNLYRLYPDGIGFVLTKDDPFVGADFDKCITNDVIAPGVIDLVKHTYCEISHSGTGLKAIGRGNPIAALKVDAVELYSEGRFFALTGRSVPGSASQIADLQDAIDRLVKHYRPNGQRARSQSGVLGDDGSLNWAFVRFLERNPTRLWRADGLPHIAMLSCPASQQLLELLRNGTIPQALAAFNDSDSERRSAVAFTTQKLGMLPEERYVLLRELTAQHRWDEQKNERQLDADHQRLIHEKFPVNPERTAGASRSRYAAFLQTPQPTEATSAEIPKIEPKRPAHRPPGEKARQIERTHQLLDDLADYDGVIRDITMAELADEFKKLFPNRRAISRSSMRDYLRAGRNAGRWVFEQENGNGRLVITLKQAVICHPKATEAAPVGETAATAEYRNPMPETCESDAQRNKEEGGNTVVLSGAPATEPLLFIARSERNAGALQIAPAQSDQPKPQPVKTAGGHTKAVSSPSSGSGSRSTQARDDYRSPGERTVATARSTQNRRYQRTAADERRSAERAIHYAPPVEADDELLSVGWPEFYPPEKKEPTLADLRAAARARMEAVKAAAVAATA